MTIEADTVASALATTWEHLISAIPAGWIRREGGVIAAVSGVPVPTMNGVWAEQVAPDPRLVTELLDRITDEGLPYCLQLRPGAPAQLASLAAGRGMVSDEDVPLMVMEGADRLGPVREAGQLAIRQLAPSESALHATVASRGFEAPEEVFLRLMTPAVLDIPGVRCYVGEIDGKAVTTGVGVTLGSFVGVFNIATPAEHRGRGFGAAVTAHAAAEGFTAGAQWSYLQSSPAGYPVYSRLGYTTVERWPCWVSQR